MSKCTGRRFIALPLAIALTVLMSPFVSAQLPKPENGIETATVVDEVCVELVVLFDQSHGELIRACRGRETQQVWGTVLDRLERSRRLPRG